MSDLDPTAPPALPLPPPGGLQPRQVSAGRGWGWIVEAFQMMRQQPLMWVLLLLAYLLLSTLIGMVPVLGQVVGSVLMPVFVGGVMLAAHKASGGGELELADLFGGFRRQFVSLLVLGLVYVGLVLLLAIALVLLMLLLGAGFGISLPPFSHDQPPSPLAVLVLALFGGSAFMLVLLAFWQAPALVVLNGVAPLPALRLSLRAGLKNWQALTLGGVMLGMLLVLAILPLFLGLLLWMPVAHLAAYAAWRDVFSAPLPAAPLSLE
jgi:hypothetical protein